MLIGLTKGVLSLSLSLLVLLMFGLGLMAGGYYLLRVQFFESLSFFIICILILILLGEQVKEVVA